MALALAVLIAIPLGLLIGHTGKGGIGVVVTANLARALPTLGLLVCSCCCSAPRPSCR